MLHNTSYHAIGLMSGTSLDGLDICYAKFWQDHQTWQYQIIHSQSLPYSPEWQQRLRNGFEADAKQLEALNVAYGHFLGQEVAAFLQKHQIEDLDIIGSHGHTIFHRPDLGYTKQIGDGRAIKTRVSCPVAYDFRPQDIFLGGQGAPLIPIGDALLFADYEACLNLGGFSNISCQQYGQRVAYDISPLNIVLNHYAQQLGWPYDDGGQIAAQTAVNLALVERLNQLEYYQQAAPKSLGLEWVNAHVFPLLMGHSPAEIIASFTAHAAQQMAENIQKLGAKKVLLTGGGAYNHHLVQLTQKQCQAQLCVPNSQLIEFKEALVFAFKGLLRWQNLPNVLASATGASHDHCSGVLA
jgi:anhydro-N-acetylmuramic acid kinase